MFTSFYVFIMSFQVAEGIPKPSDSDPIDFNYIYNVIIFIVVPILIAVFYYLWRKGRSNKE
ncbi:adenylosuccinate synthetase [Galbibacter sp.]|uniref:adenylosuccinate synthetase n=1 Tax=Galbibacter sp. TaxID=2918471 RepID=UPI003A92D4DB